VVHRLRPHLRRLPRVALRLLRRALHQHDVREDGGRRHHGLPRQRARSAVEGLALHRALLRSPRRSRAAGRRRSGRVGAGAPARGGARALRSRLARPAALPARLDGPLPLPVRVRRLRCAARAAGARTTRSATITPASAPRPRGPAPRTR
jgi:hypothetical protein